MVNAGSAYDFKSILWQEPFSHFISDNEASVEVLDMNTITLSLNNPTYFLDVGFHILDIPIEVARQIGRARHINQSVFSFLTYSGSGSSAPLHAVRIRNGKISKKRSFLIAK